FVILTVPGLGEPNRLPLWFTVLVISRDVAIVGTVAVVNLAIGPRTFRPSIYGKIATALYIVTGVAALYFNYLGQQAGLVQALIWASLIITFVSAGHYALQVAPQRQRKRDSPLFLKFEAGSCHNHLKPLFLAAPRQPAPGVAMLHAFKKGPASRQQQADELQTLIATSREERAALSTMITQV